MVRMAEEPFGIVLRRRRRVAAGLSQEELAERAGLSVRGIGDLERSRGSSIREPHMVDWAIACTLGVRDSGDGHVTESLREFVSDKHLLLLLDNCEHVLPALPIAATLLGTAPDLKVLATSRERLHLRGEREFVVDPLPVPRALDVTQYPSALDQLSTVASIQLFVQRAEALL